MVGQRLSARFIYIINYDNNITKSDNFHIRIIEKEKAKMPLKEATYREKILLYLAKNPGNNITGNKISNDLDLFYSLVHKTIKDLEKDGLLKIEKVGNYKLLKLSLDRHRTLLELALLSHRLKEEREKEGKIDSRINMFLGRITGEKDVLSIILSDKDVFIISNNVTMHLEIMSKTADIGKEISIIKHDEFGRMLSDEQFAGRMLDGIVLHGYENFWRMIAEIK
ncbi:hypothetical protein COV19_07140 [Candidatus Woesearchaeota archaeon CG10_big_fil_rev_8_21_14_0_10_44_13]|nr:MAG: hypothetical protein COV19_07140 [Candidatus Woesearchaeota archaeon CG10_big_fil_rev_8_21_14_0_10_44_13]